MLRSFKTRSKQAELMDDANISYAEFSDCLRELETINILTLAYRPTLKWVRTMLKTGLPSPTLLDVGSGGGDMLRRICRLTATGGNRLALTGVDLNPWSRQAAETCGADNINHETSNIFDFDDRRRYDLIISSLFTHHLPDTELIRFIRWMDAHATAGWFINDLHRHWLPYHFIRISTRLLSGNRLIRHDAAVSVARAFTRPDWERVMKDAGISPSESKITWHFPFRYCVSRRKAHG